MKSIIFSIAKDTMELETNSFAFSSKVPKHVFPWKYFLSTKIRETILLPFSYINNSHIFVSSSKDNFHPGQKSPRAHWQRENEHTINNRDRLKRRYAKSAVSYVLNEQSNQPDTHAYVSITFATPHLLLSIRCTMRLDRNNHRVLNRHPPAAMRRMQNNPLETKRPYRDKVGTKAAATG